MALDDVLNSLGTRRERRTRAQERRERRPGGTGLDKVLAGLSGPSGASEEPSEDAKNIEKYNKQLQTQIDKVLKSDAPESAKREARKLREQLSMEQPKKPKKNLLFKALDVLDTPRAAVVSGIKELSDLVGGGADASLDDFLQQTRDNVGVGDFVDTGNKWVDRGLGFLGDVAADPLVYLTGGSSKAVQLGAKGIARHLAAEGMDDAAARVLRNGVSAASKDELARVSARIGEDVSTGLFLRAPKIPGVGKSRRLTLPGGDASTAAMRAVGKSRGALRDSDLFQSLTKGLRGEYAPLKQALVSGDPEKALPALHTLDAVNRGKGLFRLKDREWSQLLTKELRPLRKHRDDLVAFLDEGSAEAFERLQRAGVGEHAQAVRQLLDDIVVEAQSLGVQVSRREDYFPHLITDELRQQVQKGTTKAGRFTREIPEHKRDLIRGQTFLGETLEDGTIAEINRIAREKLDDPVAVFKRDPLDVLPQYVTMMARRMGDEHAVHLMQQRGVLQDAVTVVAKDIDPKVMEEALATQQGRVVGAAGEAAAARSALDNLPTPPVNERLGEHVARIGAQQAEEGAAALDDPIRQLDELLDERALRATPEDRAAAQAQLDDMSRVGTDASEEAVQAAERDLAKAQQKLDNYLAKQRGEAVERAAAGETQAVQRARQELAKQEKRLEKLRRGGASSEMPVELIQQRLAGVNQYMQRIQQAVLKATRGGAKADDVARAIPVTMPNGTKMSAQAALRDLTYLRKQLDNELSKATTGIDELAIAQTEREIYALGEEIAGGGAIAREAVDTPPVPAKPTRHQRRLERQVADAEARFDQAAEAFANNEARLAEDILKQQDLAQRARPDLPSRAQVKGKKAELIAERESLLDEAVRLREKAATTRNGWEADVAKLEAAHREAQERFIEELGTAQRMTVEQWSGVASRPQYVRQATTALQQGLEQFRPGLVGPENIVEALRVMEKAATPDNMRSIIRHFDKVQNLWKGYALLSPGFHMRNFFGGVFNNYLADVSASSYREFASAWRRFNKRGIGALSPDERKVMDQLLESGVVGEGLYSVEIARGLPTQGRFNPVAQSNLALQKNRQAGASVETMLRGTLAYDTLKKGGSIDDALDAVHKYHFDYDDLSAFERGTMRRIVPFYTWTRKNLPLQLEMIARRPGKYTKYLHAVRNLQADPEGPAPEYFGEVGAFPLPFSIGQGQAWGAPDLPFKTVNDALDPDQALSQISPLLKVPIELKTGTQFWKNVPISDRAEDDTPWANVPLVLPALKLIGLADEDKDGNPIISQRDAYLVQSLVPQLAQLRRLYPAEQHRQDRVTTSWLSWAFGANFRSLTEREVKNALAGGNAEMRRLIGHLKDRGYLQD